MRGLIRVLGAAFVIAVLSLGAIYLFDRQAIPETGADIEVDRTALEPAVVEAPDPLGGWAIVQSNCPTRFQRGTTYVDLCWGVGRQADLDPAKDVYALTVDGTFGGGARWIVLDVRPLDTTVLPGTQGAPEGYSGGCHPLPLGDPLPPGVAAEQLCGRVDGEPGVTEGAWHVSWACEPCLFLDDADRGIGLTVQVLVPEGTLPNWTISAGIGS